ncbi:MAG: peptidoglycan editing factor PgeF [Nitrospirae bacterium]|nr:MAG: peptidoglycan editing factor PgeF [Nitrospirota bacterium]
MVLMAGQMESRRGIVNLLRASTLLDTEGAIVHFFGTRYGPSYGCLTGDWGTVKAGDPEYPVVVSVHQVHGTEVLILDHPVRVGDKFAGGWDAIATNQPHVLLTIRTADCVPVLVAAPRRHLVAAIHAGWRGALHGVVPKTVRRMQEVFGCPPSEFYVAIGPSAGVCCYEVDTPVIRLIQETVPQWDHVLRLRQDGQGQLDLKALVQQHVLDQGVPRSQIECLPLCTICRPDLFFSYRREGQVHGTMVNGIMLLAA